jgi:histidine ammonia-lyase
VEFRAPLETSLPLQGVLARLRARVPTIREDRYLAPDREAAGEMVASGALCEGLDLPELEGVA